MRKICNILIMFVLMFSVALPSTTAETGVGSDEENNTSDYSEYDTATPPEEFKHESNESNDSSEGMFTMQYIPEEVSNNQILILQNVNPWNTYSTQTVLSNLGLTYDVRSIDKVTSLSLEDYKLIIISNDQNQSFYNSYNEHKLLFEKYVENGGRLLFGISDRGWNYGTLGTMLPGNVDIGYGEYEYRNIIADESHPIITGELSDKLRLSNYHLNHNYTSHRYILEATLPEGGHVILRGADSNAPTLVEYPFGKGTIIASGLTWEHNYQYNWNFAKRAYDDLLLYAYGVETDANEIVVFLPGIMGTNLFTLDEHENNEWCCGKDHELENHSVWMPTEEDGLFAQHMIDHLAMNEDGTELDRIGVGDPVGEYYATMINRLEEEGYEVVPFGYDWRLDNSVNARLLEMKIDNLLEQNRNAKISIVAHSMGGLVASKYLINGNSNKIHKMITLGTPYLGAPKTAHIFGTGRIIGGIGGEIIDDNLLAIINNLAAPYQLFPSPLWFDLVKRSYLNVTWDYSWFKKTKNESLNTYTKTDHLLNLWLNDTFVGEAQSFHESLGLLNSVVAKDNTYFIVGSNHASIGRARIEMNQKGDDWKFGEIDDLELLNGDGTVPLISANIGGKVPKERTYYVDEAHDALASNQNVINQVVNILADSSDTLVTKMSRTPQNSSKLKLKLECPVDLHIFDEHQNHMGPNGYFIEENIPNASFYLLGKDKDKKIAFLNNGNYNLVLKGTGEGEMVFTIQLYNEEDNVEKTIRFDDVKLTPQTVMKARISDNTISNLLVDWNGDSIIDEEITPSVVLDQLQSQDEHAPTVEFSVNGTMGNNGWYTSDVSLDIQANDQETGVGKVAYTINEGGESKLYNRSIVFKEDGIYEVLGEAWDNNRNYTEEYIELKIDKTKPTIKSTAIQSTYFRGDEFVLNYEANDFGSGLQSVKAYVNGKYVSSDEKIVFNKEGLNVINILAIDHAGNIEEQSKEINVVVQVDVDFNPDVLVLPKTKSKQSKAVITTYIAFPSDIVVDRIKVDEVLLNNLIMSSDIKVDLEYNRLIVKFNRSQVESTVQIGGSVQITIDGMYNEGISFFGTDEITVK